MSRTLPFVFDRLGRSSTALHPTADDSTLTLRVICKGEGDEGKVFSCWIPENCQIGPKSIITMHLVASGAKSINITKVKVKAELPLARGDVEGYTPLRFLFWCVTPITDSASNRAQAGGKRKLRVSACKGCIKIADLRIHSLETRRQGCYGGGMIAMLLTRKGDEVDVITVNTTYRRNCHLEE